MTPARRSLLLIGLLATSAALVAWDRLRAPAVTVANAVVRKPASAAASPQKSIDEPSLSTPRERSDYLAKGRDAFPSLLPPAPAARSGAPVAAEASRPTAPPLPFTVIGKKLERDAWEVYLARGDQTYIATQGVDIAGEYRVSAIEPTQITLIYLPLNEKQTLQTGASLHD